MRVEAIQLFRYVDTLRHHHQLLFKAGVFQLHFRLFQFADQAFALPFHHIWHLATDFGHFHINAFQTLLNHGFQRCAFAFACGNKVINRQIQSAQ